MSHEDMRDSSTARRAGRSPAEVNQIVSILEAYLNDLERGGQPDQDALVRQHPALADSLRHYFANLEMLHRAAVGLQNATASETHFANTDPHGSGLLGEYRLIREIGRGGMGVVYEAEQLSLGRRIALKVLPFAAVMDPIRLQRFKNEALAAASLDHPNIVHIHSVGCERGVHYYAMQLIDGHTLAEVIRQQCCDRGIESASSGPSPLDHHSGWQLNHESALRSNLSAWKNIQTTVNNRLSTETTSRDANPFRAIACLGLQAAEALHYAHARGVRHRDIKPSNLLVDGTGKLWVTDFGLAHIDRDESLTMTGHLIGTLRYMSPEQVMAKPELVDHRVDIYALGATLYELVTLQPLFRSEHHPDLQRQIILEEPQRPRLLNPAIPVDMETIILKAVAKDLADRYTTAQALADDLRRFLEHQPILARPPTWIDRARKWSRRHAGLIAQVSLLLVLTTVALAIATSLVWRERQTAVQQRNEAQQQKKLAIERGEMLRQHAYAADMSLAWRCWEFGNIQQIRELLGRQRPSPSEMDLRGFEWFLLNRLVQSGTLVRTFSGHEGDVHGVTFSPDGNTLASASGDQTVRLWDVSSGKQQAVLRGHTDDVDAVFFYPDGRTVATSGDDGTIRRWDVRSQKAMAVMDAHDHWITHLQLASKNRLLVSSSRDNFIKLWDATSLRPVASREVDPNLYCIAVASDGKTLVSGNEDEITVWDAETLERRRHWKAHLTRVLGLSWSPDGAMLASVGEDGWLKFWDEQGNLRFEVQGFLDHHRSVQFSPDGSWLAAGKKDGMVRLWSAFSRTQLGILSGHTPQIWCLAFSPSGNLLASASGDRTIKLWRVQNPVRTFELPNGSLQRDGVAMNVAAGQLAWTSSAGPRNRPDLVNVMDVYSGAVVPEVFQPNGLQCIAMSSNSRLIAVACEDNTIRIWNRDTCSFQACLKPSQLPTSLHFSPEGSWLAGCRVEENGLGYTRLWQLSNPIRELDTPLELKSSPIVSFAPNGLWLASGNHQHGEIMVWELASLKPVHRFSITSPRSHIRCLAFSDDSRFLAVCDERVLLKVFDVKSGTTLPYFERSDAIMSCLTFTKDGKTLVTGHMDGTVHFWNLLTGHDLGSVKAHQERVLAIGFSPDQQQMFTAGLGCNSRCEVSLWSTETPNE